MELRIKDIRIHFMEGGFLHGSDPILNLYIRMDYVNGVVRKLFLEVVTIRGRRLKEELWRCKSHKPHASTSPGSEVASSTKKGRHRPE